VIKEFPTTVVLYNFLMAWAIITMYTSKYAQMDPPTAT